MAKKDPTSTPPPAAPAPPAPARPVVDTADVLGHPLFLVTAALLIAVVAGVSGFVAGAGWHLVSPRTLTGPVVQIPGGWTPDGPSHGGRGSFPEPLRGWDR